MANTALSLERASSQLPDHGVARPTTFRVFTALLSHQLDNIKSGAEGLFKTARNFSKEDAKTLTPRVAVGAGSLAVAAGVATGALHLNTPPAAAQTENISQISADDPRFNPPKGAFESRVAVGDLGKTDGSVRQEEGEVPPDNLPADPAVVGDQSEITAADPNRPKPVDIVENVSSPQGSDGTRGGSPASSAETPALSNTEAPSDDSLRSAIEDRMRTVNFAYEGEYTGKNLEVEAQSRRILQAMIAQGEVLGGEPAQSADFLSKYSQSPLNALPSPDRSLTPVLSVRAFSEGMPPQFELSAQEPARVYFGLKPDKSASRPASIARLVIILVVNGQGQHADIRPDDAWLAMHAMTIAHEINSVIPEAAKEIQKLARQPEDERNAAIDSLHKWISNPEYNLEKQTAGVKYAADGLIESLGSGKHPYLDSSLSDLLAEYRQARK